MNSPLTLMVLVCQGRTCRASGSAQVLTAFQEAFSRYTFSTRLEDFEEDAIEPSELPVKGCGCLGKCGNGPMILILPEQIWYRHVTLKQVSALAQQVWSCQPVHASAE